MTINYLKLLPILLLMLVQFTSHAQIGINSDNSVPDPSAMLDVSSTTSGFLTPRMTQAERDAISDPATSLLIYQTDNTPGFYYNRGTPSTPNWVRIGNDEQQAICDSRIPIDSVARFSNYSGRFCAYVITEPGSYYLTDSIVMSQTSATAIYIDSDNVTLDLNGYYIKGPGIDNSTASDGIFVPGTMYNITIKNGTIDDWGDDAIDANQTNNCLFQNIIASNCGDYGFWIGDNSVIIECHAYGNTTDGFNALNGCSFIRCTASENTRDGFGLFSGCQVINCTAFLNGATGIDASNDAIILGCVVSDNGGDGIETNLRSFVHKCTAHDNMGSGIDAGSSSRVSFSNASLNGEDGIRLRGNAGVIQGCVAHENDMSGIHTSSTGINRIIIEGNGVTDNDDDGIRVSGPGAFVISNRAAGNTEATNFSASDYNLHPSTNHGPIIDVILQGDISNVNGANHPYANFRY